MEDKCFEEYVDEIGDVFKPERHEFKNVFITGITGTLGTEVTSQLLRSGDYNITGYTRDEYKQKNFPFKGQVTMYLGDVRDQTRLVEATRNADIIFHFAALKHVDVMEENPEECIRTNVVGTENVLHAQRVHRIKRVVLSSTDKAAYPVNVYGFCKALSEKLVLRNKFNVVCRYGNVLASRGSVIPHFVETLKNSAHINITNKEMSRFFIKIEDAAQFIIDSARQFHGGMFIPDMKACKMTEIASAIADLIGINEFEYNDVGIRPGEKLAECLSTFVEGKEVFSSTAPQFEKEELKNMLRPIVASLL